MQCASATTENDVTAFANIRRDTAAEPHTLPPSLAVVSLFSRNLICMCFEPLSSAAPFQCIEFL